MPHTKTHKAPKRAVRPYPPTRGSTTRPASVNGKGVKPKPVGRPTRKPTPKPREPVDKQTFQARPRRTPANRRPKKKMTKK